MFRPFLPLIFTIQRGKIPEWTLPVLLSFALITWKNSLEQPKLGVSEQERAFLHEEERLKDGRPKDFDLAIFIAKHKTAKPLAFFDGAALPVKHGHMLTAADNA